MVIMPQLVLPLFSPDCKLINNQVGFEKIGSRIYYFHGRLPVFIHEEDDLESFRFIASQCTNLSLDLRTKFIFLLLLSYKCFC